MGPLGELGALFNPGMRHEIEEQQSKANRREEEGNARDGDLRIDLASGVAVINIAKADHHAAPAAHDVSRPESKSAGAADRAADGARRPVGGSSDDASQSGADHSPSADSSTDAADGAPAEGARTDAAASDGTPADGAPSPTARGSATLTAAQARRVAAAARRSAGGDRPARPATPRPANAQLPSSKASRAAR